MGASVDLKAASNEGQTIMIRKTIVAIAAATAFSAITFAPTVASAGHWGGAHRGFRHRGHWHFYGPRFFRHHSPGFASCWRWLPTRFGYAKVWVCG